MRRILALCNPRWKPSLTPSGDREQRLSRPDDRRLIPSSLYPTETLATSTLPPRRDFFYLPSIDAARLRTPQCSSPTAPTPASPYKLPSLDSFQPQAGTYWPGALSPTSTSTVQQVLGTLPTPPSDHQDSYKAPVQTRDAPYSAINSISGMAAAAAVQQPTMTSNLETNPPTSGLTARRPAANNLPSMELPPVPFVQPPQKPTPMNMSLTTAQTNIGNLLTPPSTLPGDSVSPNSLTQLLATGTATSQGIPSLGNYNYLPPPPSGATGTTPLGMGSGLTPSGSWPANLRGMFSPSLFSQVPTTSSISPLRTEGLPPPPYDVPPPLTNYASTSLSGPHTLPAMAAQQQPINFAAQAQNQNQTQSQTQTQAPLSVTQPTQSPPANATDPYMQRPNSTPSSTYYPSTQPQSAALPTFPPFHAQTSPVTQSPMSAPLIGSRMSPPGLQGSSFSPNASHFGGYRTQYPNYSLPAMSTGPASAPLTGHVGPIMTNMHNPQGSLIMQGMPSQALPPGMMQQGYPMTSGQAAAMFGAGQSHLAVNERPFKCDQCPQSFNRNHDLKRHKRIHLAVKPFPCKHCDKSFSRKDALKVAHSFISRPY